MKFFNYLLLYLTYLPVFSICNSDSIKEDQPTDVTLDEVLSYTEEEFKSNVPEVPHFVMFYAPWCGHCQHLKPIWEKLAKEIEEDTSTDVAIIKVDCTVESSLCSDEGVLGYPTLKFYHPEKEAVRHKGGRDLSSLKAFIAATMETKSDVEKIVHNEGLFDLTDSNFESHIGSSSHFIMFYAPWCGHCRRLEPVWEELAKSHQPSDENQDDVKIAKVDCTLNREICQKHSVRGYPTLLFFKNGEMVQKYQEGRQLDALERFVARMLSGGDESASDESETSDGLHELNDGTFAEHTSTGHHFIKFYAPWCGHCRTLEPTWQKLASAHQQPTDNDEGSRVKIGRVDCTKSREICSNHGVRGYPTLLWFKDGEKIKSYTGGRDFASLNGFISEMLLLDDEEEEAAVTAKPVEEKEEEAEPESPVIELSDENFDFHTALDVTFVMFFAPWCGFCKRLEPTWVELATQDFAPLQHEVKIARIDCTKHDAICQQHKVHGYPTLLLFKDGVMLDRYNGQRTLDDLKKFVIETAEKDAAIVEGKDEL